MRFPDVMLTMLPCVLLAGCTGQGPDLLLLDASTDARQVTEAQLVEELPAGLGDCGQAQQERWSDEPTMSPVVRVDEGYTVVLSGISDIDGADVDGADVDGADADLVVVCDFNAAGDLLVVDELNSTGTSRSVGNDYIQRAGSIQGRVDVGIPSDAVRAEQQLGQRTVVIPLTADMRVVRFHAALGGGPDSGFDIGVVTFLDADGEDVTAESVPIPDIVHGVPRSRGSGVN